MKGTIYLIGGGEIGTGETVLIDNEILATGKEGELLLFFPTAAHDSLEYGNVIKEVYGKKYQVEIISRNEGKPTCLDLIKKAKVIYLGGGETLLLADLISEWGLKQALLEFLERGGVIAGISAGMLVLSEWFIHEEDNIFELRRGIGLLKITSLAHATEENFKKSETLLLSNSEAASLPFVGVGEGVAVRIQEKNFTKVGTGKLYPEYIDLSHII